MTLKMKFKIATLVTVMVLILISTVLVMPFVVFGLYGDDIYSRWGSLYFEMTLLLAWVWSSPVFVIVYMVVSKFGNKWQNELDNQNNMEDR